MYWLPNVFHVIQERCVSVNTYNGAGGGVHENCPSKAVYRGVGGTPGKGEG